MFHSAHTLGRSVGCNDRRDDGPDDVLVVAGPSRRSTLQSADANAEQEGAGWQLAGDRHVPAGERPSATQVSRSYHDDGTMICSDQGTVTTEPPTVFSSCHGVWTHLEKRTFAYTGFELISDLSGNLVGYLKVRGIYTVSDVRERVQRNDLRRDTRYRRQRPLLGDVTNAGQRIQVELP